MFERLTFAACLTAAVTAPLYTIVPAEPYGMSTYRYEADETGGPRDDAHTREWIALTRIQADGVKLTMSDGEGTNSMVYAVIGPDGTWRRDDGGTFPRQPSPLPAATPAGTDATTSGNVPGGPRGGSTSALAVTRDIPFHVRVLAALTAQQRAPGAAGPWTVSDPSSLQLTARVGTATGERTQIVADGSAPEPGGAARFTRAVVTPVCTAPPPARARLARCGF
ncbi:MAG: hypothetical protein ABR591_15055 [Candidatus Velthaea sp.]